MKILTFLIIPLLACAPALAGDDIEDLATLMHGKFDTRVVRPDHAPEERLVDRRVRFDAPNLGSYVFYQQINHRESLEVYRQRILVLQVSEAGTIEQQAYAIREPEWYVDAEATALASLTMDDLEAFMPHGCEQIWSRVENGFRGYVDPKRCQIISSRTGKQRQIESENYLTEDSISLVERGYDPDSGEQLFGSPQGESLLLGRVR